LLSVALNRVDDRWWVVTSDSPAFSPSAAEAFVILLDAAIDWLEVLSGHLRPDDPTHEPQQYFDWGLSRPAVPNHFSEAF